MASFTQPTEEFLENARRAPRIPVELTAEVSVSGTRWVAQLADLGSGGCLIVSPRPLLQGTALRLVLAPEAVAEPLHVTGQVAWVSADRCGIAFAARQSADPGAWLEALLRRQPRLRERRGVAPARLGLGAPLYLQPAPRAALTLGEEERALLRAAENGLSVRELLARTGVPAGQARHALFSLFEKNVLTLSLGRASEPWRWRALYPGPEASALPTIVRTPRAAALQSRAAPRIERVWEGAQPGQRGQPAAPDLQAALLRGAGVAGRPAKAEERLAEARKAAGEGRIGDAVVLLRQALALAPRDLEIGRLLGQLSFKDRATT